ncbi:PilZ domain-containing protein [bacterium]|nr:PilZ domain-containing protein [bacterium]
MEDNRRLEYRIKADMVVEDLELDPPSSQKVKGSIRELSASGCRLESSIVFAVNQQIHISFHLEGGHELKNITARVVRRLSQRTHKVVAVEFVALTEEEQHKIREFVIWKEGQEASA